MKLDKWLIAGEAVDADNTWDDVHMICPSQCVCQYAPYMDLSIAHWIQGMRHEPFDDTITTTTTINGERITSNEVRAVYH